ncbi:hypothetical protein TI04_02085 [Achromatium sp. WMS2]|nr:hypothetical protein TI04_02085 [Achromatium sp. WMS2]
MDSVILNTLVPSALVGVSKRPLPPLTLPPNVEKLLNSIQNANDADRLLQTAGLVSFIGEFATDPKISQSHINLKVAPEETLPTVDSELLSDVVTTLIHKGMVKILIELCQIVCKRGMRIAPAYLPNLLEMALRYPELNQALANASGQRYHWLTQINPRWHKLQPMATLAPTALNDQIEDMEHTANGRSALLTTLYQQNQELASKKLSEYLAQGNAQERQDLIATIPQHLATKYVSILDPLIQDRSKGVRQQVAKLLSNVPASDFAIAISSSVNTIITIKKLKNEFSLQITIPDTFNKDWQKLGIEEKPPSGEGNKAFWLRQILALTPLDWWSQHKIDAPDAVLQLVLKSDWQIPLLKGLSMATVTQSNVSWANSILNAIDTQLEHPEQMALLGVATPNIAETVLQNRLQQHPGTDVFLEITYQAASLAEWSVAFGEFMLANLREKLKDLRSNTQPGQEIATHLPPACLAMAAANWPDHVHDFVLRNFLEIIRLRTIIHNELGQSL